MSLLHDIQKDAVDASTDVSTLLRKCVVLSARLGNDEFEAWVNHELNGYPDEHNLPSYRILDTQSLGHFSGRWGSVMENAPMSMRCLPQKIREAMSHSYLLDPISSYVDLLQGTDRSNAQEPWPPDVTAIVGSKIYQHMNCLSAWKVIPRNAIAGVVDAVRNRILDFALRIEAEDPDAGEAPLDSSPVPQEKVSQVFHTVIHGNVQNVAAGGRGFSQIAEINVTAGDFNTLAKYLESLGVSKEDVHDLEESTQADSANGPPIDGFGSRVSDWIGNMVAKAASGVWKVGAAAAADLLTTAISSYYGIPT